MKSETLNVGDRLFVTQEFLDDNKQHNPNTYQIWRTFRTLKVLDLSEYSTVKIGMGVFSTWVTNPIAENMRKAYEENDKNKSEDRSIF